MNFIEKPNHFEMKSLLSTLWIFIFLNILFKDIHELLRAGYIEQMISGTVNGNQVTELTLLIAAIGLQLPISMIVLSRVLAYPINRRLNMILPVLTAVIILTNEPNPDPDNIFFAIINVAVSGLIIWLAWQWPNPKPA
ncbi:MAG: DUF6326 family protein [Chloroflexota bacterium]